MTLVSFGVLLVPLGMTLPNYNDKKYVLLEYADDVLLYKFTTGDTDTILSSSLSLK